MKLTMENALVGYKARYAKNPRQELFTITGKWINSRGYKYVEVTGARGGIWAIKEADFIYWDVLRE